MTTRSPSLVRLALAAIALALAACGGKPAEDTSKEGLAAAAQKAGTANGLCPVMRRPVVPDVSTDYQGQRIGFCCPPCGPKFRAEPERYMEAMRKDPAAFAYDKDRKAP